MILKKINEAQSHAEQEETISNTQEEETLHVNNNEKGKVIEVKDIVASMKPICKKNVTCDAMSGEEIRAILQLNTTPDLNRVDHKKFFYSIRSSKMQTITKFYKNPKPNVANNQKWMQKLASYLLTLQHSDWSISINDLAEGQTIDEDLLLL